MKKYTFSCTQNKTRSCTNIIRRSRLLRHDNADEVAIRQAAGCLSHCRFACHVYDLESEIILFQIHEPDNYVYFTRQLHGLHVMVMSSYQTTLRHSNDASSFKRRFVIQTTLRHFQFKCTVHVSLYTHVQGKYGYVCTCMYVSHTYLFMLVNTYAGKCTGTRIYIICMDMYVCIYK
jgi:hypothetical protein